MRAREAVNADKPSVNTSKTKRRAVERGSPRQVTRRHQHADALGRLEQAGDKVHEAGDQAKGEESDRENSQGRHKKQKRILQRVRNPFCSLQCFLRLLAELPQSVACGDEQKHIQPVALPPRGTEGARPFLFIRDDRIFRGAQGRNQNLNDENNRDPQQTITKDLRRHADAQATRPR